MTSGVVLARSGSTYRVHVEGREIVATLRGKLKHKDDDRVVVGDVVEMDMESDDSGAITGIKERRSVLQRRAAGQGAGRSQPIAANVDQVLVVASARDPELTPRMIDRFLVIAEANHLPAFVVVNKSELDREAGPALADRYRAAAYFDRSNAAVTRHAFAGCGQSGNRRRIARQYPAVDRKTR